MENKVTTGTVAMDRTFKHIKERRYARASKKKSKEKLSKKKNKEKLLSEVSRNLRK